MITIEQARSLEQCIEGGGVAVFPADTVYGLACDPEHEGAVNRLYELKRRSPGKPAAVLHFSLDAALESLPEVIGRTRSALEMLLPGPLTALLPNPGGRFPLACGPDRRTLGLRVPAMEHALAPLGSVRRPVLQSSANLAGGADARLLSQVPQEILDGADLVLDGGELPGTASTVVDLREFETTGRWSIVRRGAVGEDEIARRLG